MPKSTANKNLNIHVYSVLIKRVPRWMKRIPDHLWAKWSLPGEVHITVQVRTSIIDSIFGARPALSFTIPITARSDLIRLRKAAAQVLSKFTYQFKAYNQHYSLALDSYSLSFQTFYCRKLFIFLSNQGTACHSSSTARTFIRRKSEGKHVIVSNDPGKSDRRRTFLGKELF